MQPFVTTSYCIFVGGTEVVKCFNSTIGCTSFKLATVPLNMKIENSKSFPLTTALLAVISISRSEYVTHLGHSSAYPFFPSSVSVFLWSSLFAFSCMIHCKASMQIWCYLSRETWIGKVALLKYFLSKVAWKPISNDSTNKSKSHKNLPHRRITIFLLFTYKND